MRSELLELKQNPVVKASSEETPLVPPFEANLNCEYYYSTERQELARNIPMSFQPTIPSYQPSHLDIDVSQAHEMLATVNEGL